MNPGRGSGRGGRHPWSSDKAHYVVEGVLELPLDSQASVQGSQWKLLNVVEAVGELTPGPVIRPTTWLRASLSFPWTLRQVAKGPR